MNIRRATFKDIEALWVVRTAAIQGISNDFYTKAEIETWAFTEKPNAFDIVIQKLDWYVAEENGVICGCGFLDTNTGQIGAIFVDPKFQRRGIGLQILNRLEEISREKNIKVLYLDATLNAEAFYKAAGFSAIAKSKECRTVYHHVSGLDFNCIKMQKVLR